MSDYGLPDDEDDDPVPSEDDLFPSVESADAVYEPIVQPSGRHDRANPFSTGLETAYTVGEHEYTVGFDRRTVKRIGRQCVKNKVTSEHLIDRAVRHYLEWLETYF
jgi:hypothetical protein